MHDLSMAFPRDIFPCKSRACPPQSYPPQRMLTRQGGEEHGNGFLREQKKKKRGRCPRSIIPGSTDRKKGKFLD